MLLQVRIRLFGKLILLLLTRRRASYNAFVDILSEVLLTLVAMSFAYAALVGVIRGEIVIRRGYRTVQRVREPFRFWLSIFLAVVAVIFLMYVAIIPTGERIFHKADVSPSNANVQAGEEVTIHNLVV